MPGIILVFFKAEGQYVSLVFEALLNLKSKHKIEASFVGYDFLYITAAYCLDYQVYNNYTFPNLDTIQNSHLSKRILPLFCK